MNIRDLKYLVAIADHNHFGLAAEACFVTQPALSMQIKKLETHLGVQLIERTSKSARLTEVGKLMTEHARDILYRVETMKEYAKLANDPFSGELHLGVIPTLAPYLLPHIFPGLAKIFPNLTIFLVEDQTAYLLTKLKEGKLDAVLVGLPPTVKDFVSSPLFEEEFLLATPPNHPLSKRKSIRISDLENKVLLLLEDGHCMRDLALELCYRAKATESKGFRATSLETLRHMVASNAGITLMPKLASKPNDGIAYVPFNADKPSRIIGIIWRPSSPRKILLEKMTEKIRKLLLKQKSVRVINTPVLCKK